MMIRFLICKDMVELIDKEQEEIACMCLNINEENRKERFVYAYSIFESTLTEILRYYLYAFPEKVDKTSFEIEKNDFLSTEVTNNLLQKIIDKYIRKYSSGTMSEYVKFFEKTLSINMDVDVEAIKKISAIRNDIVHDDFRYRLLYRHRHNSEKSEKIILDDMRESLKVLSQILNNMKNNIMQLYSKYTKEKLVRDLWNYVFTTPLLPFDKIWEVGNAGELRLGDFEYIKKISTMICRSEQLFLAVFFQQYNTTINQEINPYTRIPALIGLDECSKEKLIKIISFFNYFPLFFCGDNIVD